MPGSLRPLAEKWPPPRPVFVSGDVRFLAMLAAVATVLLIAAIVHQIGTTLMKRIVLVAALAAASLGLSGCITAAIAKMTPEQQIGLINAAANAGCSGTIGIGAGASTAAGVSPGSAHGEFSFNGTCDPAKARPTAPAAGAAPQ